MQQTRKMTVAGIALLAILLGTGLLGGVSLMAASVGSNSGSPAAGEGQITDEYIWPPEQQRQREEAIRKRDRSLLPVCTDAYVAWRNAAKAAGKLDAQRPRLDFWAKPGCKGRPNGGSWGPKGSPGPAPSATYTGNNKWYIGNYTVNESTYDRGIYAEMEIVDPGVDHSTSDDFFAARVYVSGTNGYDLEGGWFEAAFSSDTDQHIYGQDSHSCSGNPPVCYWEWFDQTCDNTRIAAQVAIDPDNSTQWTSSCWDGDSWNTMQSLVTLGDDDAAFLEVTGELLRTVSGETNLTTDGVYFREIAVADTSGYWDWGASVSADFWGTDSSYTREDVSYYDEFNMKN
ncbi:MAG: hypothetical protein HYU30_10700 [Chloroflexi bacterium]|nr:hypothetical protein [Chloroflexota bacterium]